jgi:hypothetical protein
MTPARASEELSYLSNYSEALHLANIFWQEKAKSVRFLEGYMNIAFFHKAAKIREGQSQINFLKNGDVVLTEVNDIEAHVLE